ncbi:MAG: DUF975 family protein, partial [Atopostipes sp.]|nr:DUF975 family protein [Atopostipes sp.]
MSFITKESLYTSRDIKIEAKAQLKGNWKNAILLAIIPIVFSIFFVGETEPEMVQMSTGRGLLNIVLRLIHSFMLVSVSFTFLDFLRNQKKINPLEGAFQAFKKEYFV